MHRGPSAMSGIRPFVEDADLHQVADLHHVVFGGRGAVADYLVYEKYFSKVFLRNPWRDDALPSLVYEDADGITGFLGVAPRPMMMKGRPLRAAIASQFMVHPKKRGRVGLQLVRAFLSGPQDLSLTEGNAATRAVWEALGGTTLLLYNIRWTRLLRPSRCALSFLKRHGTPSVVVTALTPLGIAIDGILEGLTQGPFRVSPSNTTGEELTGHGLLASLSEVSGARSLHPHYDHQSIEWILARLADKSPHGYLRKVLVRSAAREAAGCYLYYSNPGGIGEVMQVAASHGAMGDVLDHLFYDAWDQGAVAVSGPLDPGFMQTFSEARCILHGRETVWFLAHAKRPEQLEPFHRGDAFLTMLEGDGAVDDQDVAGSRSRGRVSKETRYGTDRGSHWRAFR